MRTVVLLIFTATLFSVSAQNTNDLIGLLGKKPNEVDLIEFLGTEIDTVHSATWRFIAKAAGIMVQAHIDQFNKENAVFTTVTFYFTKKGYGFYQGTLPYGIRPSKSWNKNRVILYQEQGFTDLEATTDLDLGRRLEFKTVINKQNVYVTALYLNNDKGTVNKKMYSLQFSILSGKN